MTAVAQVPGLYRRLRSRIAPGTKAALLRGGVFRLVRAVAPSRQLAILRYHAICGPEGHRYASPEICISPAAFEDHVRYLASRYRVLPLPEAVAALRSGRSLPPNAVALTFDDGYADNYAAAATLARYGVSGTFYITANCLQGGSPFWPAEIRYLVAALPGPDLSFESMGEVIRLSLATAGERTAAVRTVTRLLKSRTIPERDRVRNLLRSAAAHPPLPDFMLTWSQVREMRRMGMTIGAHTLTHPNLPSAGLAAAESEIRGARERLEKETDAPVTMFSYPNGGAEVYCTPALERLVADAGYQAATTSRNGFATRSSSPFALERVQVAETLEDLVFSLEIERLVDGRKAGR